MKNLLKEYKSILLVLGYIFIASIVYGYLVDKLFSLWYVTLITILVIVIIGSVIGYFYVKNEYIKNQNNIENNQ